MFLKVLSSKSFNIPKNKYKNFINLSQNICLNINKCNFSTQVNDILKIPKVEKYLNKIVLEYNQLPKNKKINDIYRNLFSTVENINKRNQILETLKELEEMKKDNDLASLAEKDMALSLEELESVEDALIQNIVPSDPDEDTHNLILEISPGAGGREAMLFALDIWNMYQSYANYRGWNVEISDYMKSEEGGLRIGSAFIEGKDAYSSMRFEAGVHRVQRVPSTERSGRIHTSTVSVACLPQAPESFEINIPAKNLKIETKRATGAGGQHVNTTDSAVRITHLPSGIVVECQVDRSQHRNRTIAMQKLRAKLYEVHMRDVMKGIQDLRRVQIGQKDRSEKIRTYNFTQDRITDHRLSENFFNLPTFMEGGAPLDKMINQLKISHRKLILDNWIKSLD